MNNVMTWRLRLLRHMGIKFGKELSLLDVGCGDGGDCAVFAGHCREVTGIDIEPHSNWPAITGADAGVKLLAADACRLPFADNRFDIVFSKDVLHHVEDHRQALREMKRVTKNGGRVIIIEANRYNPVFYLHMTLLRGHHHFTRSYFRALLKEFFEDVSFLSLESHVYPARVTPLLRLIHGVEDTLGKIHPLRPFLSYNIAVAGKNEAARA